MKQPKEIIPLYGRVAAIIENKIISGQYAPGDKLPTEDELVTYYGVSKITIRGALSRLEESGYINRIRGKGTFVTDSIPSITQTVSSNLQETIQLAGFMNIISVEMDVVTVKFSRTPKDICNFFNCSTEDQVLRIQRVISPGNFFYYYDNYMPVSYADYFSVDEIKEKKSLQTILREKMNLKVTKGDMYLQALPSDPDISQKLQCPSFEPLINVQTQFWHKDKEPFELLNIYFRSCYFKYKVELDINLAENYKEK